MIVSDTKWQPDLSDAGKSKYKALAQAIREGIVSGQLAGGSKLPPVRDLAYQLGITPGTVARAYTLLTDEGRLIAGVGRGTFVAERKTVGLLREGMMHLAQTMPADHLLNYPTRETDLAARQACREMLMTAPIGSFTVDDVITSHGGQHAIVMILQTILHGPAPVVAVDELSYGGFRSAAMLSRAQVVGVPSDADGPLPAALETLIKTKGVQVFCTSAEVNNPTLVSTTLQRRQEIATLAERYGVHVIDDDCYRLHDTPHDGPSYRALLPDLGWYVTSPSKSLTAALRIGFAVAPQDWTKNIARTSTFHSFGVTRLVSDLYAYIMAHEDLNVVVADVKARIAEDVRAAVNALGGHRLAWSEHVPFLLLELPLGWRASDFRQAAEKQGVLIKSAEDFALRDGRSHQAVRIAINGQNSHARFAEAMRALRTLLDQPPEQISV